MKLLSLIFILFSCSTPPPKGELQKFDELIKVAKCEEAAEVVPIQKENIPKIEKAKAALGNGAAAIITVSGYAALSTGTILLSLLDLRALGLFSKFPNIWEGTKSIRCPNLDNLSRGIGEVASCFGSRNNYENLSKANVYLLGQKKYFDFEKCTSSDAKLSYTDIELEIQKKLKPKAIEKLFKVSLSGTEEEVARLHMIDQVDVNSKNIDGDNALKVAIKFKNFEVFTYLVDSNVNYYEKGKDGKSTWDISLEIYNSGDMRFYKYLGGRK